MISSVRLKKKCRKSKKGAVVPVLGPVYFVDRAGRVVNRETGRRFSGVVMDQQQAERMLADGSAVVPGKDGDE
jgi:hypothetical protein